MGNVTIGAYSYDVYGSTAGLAEYANGDPDFGPAYTAAVDSDPDQVARAHVASSRLLARQPFADAANAVPATAAGDVVTACYELTLAALVDAAAIQDVAPSNVKRIEAKGVATEFFAPSVTTGARFPARVLALLGPLLEGAIGSDGEVTGGMFVSGVDSCSDFDESDRYGLTTA